jgi:type I restriction enzyme S subunit
VSDLPKGWAEAKIEEIAEYNPKHSKDLADDLPISFVPMPVVSESSPNIGTHGTRRYGEVRKGYTHFANGDVLVAKITPCFENGKAAIASGLVNGIGCGSTEFHVLRPTKAILPELLYHYLHRGQFRKDAKSQMTGTAGQLRVPSDLIKELPIPLAPLNEQKRIVAKLDELLPKVESCKQRLEKIPLILKRFRQSVLAAAISGKLTEKWRNTNSLLSGKEIYEQALMNKPQQASKRSRATKGIFVDRPDFEIPASWELYRVRELISAGIIIDLQDGNHGELYPRKEEFGEVGVPYLTAENVIDDRVNLDTAPKLRPEKAKLLRIGFAKGDDVILTHNATVGRVGILPPGVDSVILSTSTTYYRVNKKYYMPEFLALVLRSSLFQAQLAGIMEQTTRNQVSITKQVEFFVPLLSLEEQAQVVRTIPRFLEYIKLATDRFIMAEQQISNLIDSVLSQAFSGTLVAQDPSDEPASILLERLKASSATTTNGSKPKRTKLSKESTVSASV